MSLDSSIKEKWYQSQNHDLDLSRQAILSKTGDPKPDLEDIDDDEDQIHEHVSQEGIKVFLTRMIEDEMNDGYIICEVNGEQTPIKYTPSIHNPHFMPAQRNCYPVATRSKSKGQEENSTTAVHETNIAGEEEVVFEYNNQAKPSLLTDPKCVSPSTQNYKKYAKYLLPRR